MARSLFVKTAVVVAISLTFFLTGWWLRAQTVNRTESAEPRDRVDADRRVVRLEQELSILQRQVSEQRQIIRDHALTPPNRSFDEILALFPAKFPKGNWAPGNTAYEDCWFEAVDGIRLHGWYFRQPDPTAIVLHVHGNAGNVTHRARLAASLRERLKASVLVFDYRGYGRSEGVPTMEGILRDARAARDYLVVREGASPAEIVLMGRSLGGAVAVQLAGEEGARGLVLESTFSSFRKVAISRYPETLVNLLVADRLDSASAIRDYHGPLLQSHGDADRTIPFALGRELFEAANAPKTFITIPEGDHNDRQTEEYYQQLKQFIQALP